jgi:hypothetical protein
MSPTKKGGGYPPDGIELETSRTAPDLTRRNGMARRRPPRKVTYFEPVPPRLARNTIIESTFEVGRRFRCTMRVDCGQLDPPRWSGRYPANGSRACPSASTKRSSRIGRLGAMRSISSPH